MPCQDIDDPDRTGATIDDARARRCKEGHEHDDAAQGFGRTVPVTPGRQFAQEPRWNAWFDGRSLDSTDRRHGLDTDGSGSYFTLGMDRHFDNGLVAGGLLSYEDNDSDGFGGSMRLKSDGFGVGAYLAQPLSQAWALDASLTYAQISNDTRIDILEGSYDTQRTSLTVDASGQYAAGEFILRPKATLSFSHFDNEAYDLSGVVLDTPIALKVARDSFDYGALGGTVEGSRIFETAHSVIIPYIEIGARYDFIRPNDGELLTADLTLASTSAWVGSLRVGARALIARATFVETSAGYLSLGQNDNDVWEFRLYVSRGF